MFPRTVPSRIFTLPHILLVASVLYAGGATHAVRAQDEAARAHFQSGAAYYDSGEYEDAAREFMRAYDMSQRAALFYNIALAYQGMGDLENAVTYLERYLNDVQEIPNRATLERRLENLKLRAEQQQQPQATPAPPDPETSKGRSRRQSTQADETPTPATPILAQPAAEAATASQTTEATNRSAQSTAATQGGVPKPALYAWIAGSVGVAAATAFGVMALSERTSIEDGCGANSSCSPSQVNRLETLALVTDISIGVAVAGAAVGTVLWMTHREEPPRAKPLPGPESEPRAAAPPKKPSFSVQMAPWLAHTPARVAQASTSLGLLVHGRF